MEDESKVEKKVGELNKKSPKKWVAFDGFFALTKFDFGKNAESPVFSPASGVPIKVFANEKTGELRIFPGLDFLMKNE